MKNKVLPAAGIIVVAAILILVNELTNTTIIKDYAYLFIIGGMLFGFILARMSGKNTQKSDN